jgi:DNA-binding MarR family transcriptional regulator
MTRPPHTPRGEAATELILETFRCNGRLLAAGDRLVAKLGLTSARWQVLGAIALSPTVETVARLARNMGLHRQGVQRIVNELEKEGLIEFRPNPHHRRANLVVLTARGREIYEEADRLQIPWVNALSKGIAADDIALATRVIQSLRKRLEEQSKLEPEKDD